LIGVTVREYREIEAGKPHAEPGYVPTDLRPVRVARELPGKVVTFAAAASRRRGHRGYAGRMAGSYDPQYPRPDVNRDLDKGRQREAEERARKDHIADEIRPPWWRRLGQALRGGRSSNPPRS
jgi:hypothetical protein